MGCSNVILNNTEILKQHSATVKQSSVLYKCTERKRTQVKLITRKTDSNLH